MGKLIPESLTVIITGLVLLLLSCAPESCFEETNAFVKASFYFNKNSKLQAADSLTLYGYNQANRKIYNKSTNIQSALIPLNASTTSSVFIIRINGTSDTMKLSYNSYPHLISKECGYTFYHNLISDSLVCTTHIVDSIRITNRNITTITNEENIRIFY